MSDATHYARNSVYTKLKFDKFIATSGSDDTADNVSTFGAYPSDASTYDNVLSEIDTNKNQFCLVKAINNF